MAVQLVGVGVTLPGVGVSLTPTTVQLPWNGESLLGGVSILPTAGTIGNLVAQSAAVAGEGVTPYAGIGTLSAQAGAIAGDGTVASVVHSSQAIAFLARTSGLDAAHTNAYYSLIDGLVADGAWSQFDVLYVFATQDETTALLNLVSSNYDGTNTGGITFTADQGFSGGVTATKYVDTNFNPLLAGGLYSDNSAHMAVWDYGPAGAPGTNGDQHVQFAFGGNDVIYANFGGSCYVRIENGGAPGAAVPTTVGLSAGSRTSSDAWSSYKNGAPLSSGSDVTGGVPNSKLTIPWSNDASVDIIMAGSAGAALSSVDHSNLYLRLHPYLQTIAGVP